MSMSRFKLKRVLSEKGLGLIEIMIATFFLFFALSVLLTVMSTAGMMVSNSRAIDRATFLASEKMEWLRSLPFKDVGYAAPNLADDYEPSGILPRTETVNVSGTDFTLDYNIRWIDDPGDLLRTTSTTETLIDPGTGYPRWQDYKRVIITVSWGAPAARKNYVVASNISGRGSLGVPPLVSFVPPTPANNSVVSGNAVTIAVRGQQGSTASAVAFIGLEIGGGILNFGQSYNPPLTDKTEEFIWNTTTRDATTNELLTPDGIYEARGIARDAKGTEAYISYFFIVNNYPPDQVTSATVRTYGVTTTVTSDTTVPGGSLGCNLAWDKVKDGREDVMTYKIYRNTTVTVNVSGLSYNDSNLPAWATYNYEIAAFTYGNESTKTAFSPSSITTWFKVDGCLKKISGKNYPSMAWTNGSAYGTTHYHIYKSTGGVFSDYANTTNTFWQEASGNNIPNNTTWVYYIVAHNATHTQLNRSHAVVFQN